MYTDPLLATAFPAAGYAAFVLITSSADPFVRTRRSTRQLQLNAGRTVGAALALGWIPTLWLADGRGSALRIGFVGAAVLVGIVCALWAVRAAHRALRRRRRAARRRAAEPVADPVADPMANAETGDQMARLAENVRHHDIGDDAPAHGNASTEPPRDGASPADDKRDDAATLPAPPSPASLPALRGEIVKLRKLVIAQHAALEAERASHQRTREREQEILAKARRLQLRAMALEKMARREFAARRRIEARQQETAEALANARALLALEEA